MSVNTTKKSHLKAFKKKVKSQLTPISKCWNNCDIPAKLFYKIIETNDHSLLTIEGNPDKTQLNNAWRSIYDEFFTIKNDGKLKLVLKSQIQVIKLEFKIQTIKNILYAISTTPLTKDERIKLIEGVNSIGLNIDVEKYKLEVGKKSELFLKGEIIRVNKTVLPHLINRLNLEKGNYDNLTEKKEIVSSFEDNCVNIENALNRSVDDKMTLRKYLAYEKSVIKLSKRNE